MLKTLLLSALLLSLPHSSISSFPAPQASPEEPPLLAGELLYAHPTTATENLLPGAATLSSPTVNLVAQAGNPAQKWVGTGAALTDAAVDELQRTPSLLPLLFDPANPAGAQLDTVRLPLSATDMTPGGPSAYWTWAWDGVEATPAPQQLEALAVLEDILELQPDMEAEARPMAYAGPMTYFAITKLEVKP